MVEIQMDHGNLQLDGKLGKQRFFLGANITHFMDGAVDLCAGTAGN